MNHTISGEDAANNATAQSLIVITILFAVICISFYCQKSRKNQEASVERAKIRLEIRNYV